jgi:hypothetical protein
MYLASHVGSEFHPLVSWSDEDVLLEVDGSVFSECVEIFLLYLSLKLAYSTRRYLAKLVSR